MSRPALNRDELHARSNAALKRLGIVKSCRFPDCGSTAKNGPLVDGYCAQHVERGELQELEALEREARNAERLLALGDFS